MFAEKIWGGRLEYDQPKFIKLTKYVSIYALLVCLTGCLFVSNKHQHVLLLFILKAYKFQAYSCET